MNIHRYIYIYLYRERETEESQDQNSAAEAGSDRHEQVPRGMCDERTQRRCAEDMWLASIITLQPRLS